MTGPQLQRLLDRIELSQSAAARALEISDRQMRRLVAESTEIPRLYEFAVRYLAGEVSGFDVKTYARPASKREAAADL